MRTIARAVGILILGLLLPVVGSAASSDPTILEFKTMVGVSGPFVGSANPIRGINGGGAPWTISEGRGELRASVKLEVRPGGWFWFRQGRTR